MRHLPRSHSKGFRIVLAMALLAWAALASGAPRMLGSMGAAHSQLNAVDTSMHCAAMPQAHVIQHHHFAPAVPGAQSDCCHGGCHCLSACSVALLVPFVTASAIPKPACVRARVTAAATTVSAAPPLRPPIA